MSSAALSKVLLPGFLLTGFAVSGNAADAVIVAELIDAETLLGTPGEVALTSNRKGNLVSRHAKSDAGGRVEFGQLAAGEWRLTTKVAGYAAEHAGVRVGVGETRRVSLYLKQGKLLSGRVSDAAGKPVTRALDAQN